MCLDIRFIPVSPSFCMGSTVRRFTECQPEFSRRFAATIYIGYVESRRDNRWSVRTEILHIDLSALILTFDLKEFG